MKLSTAMIALAGLLLFAGTCLADGHEKEMGAEEEAMMEAWLASAEIGKPHERLAETAGKYKAVMYSWNQPGAEPTRSDMVVERSMELGGRIRVEHWKGEVMGMPFEGTGRTGYDNIKKRYWTTWVDNMSTSLYVAYGKWDEDKEAIVYEGDAIDPMSGADVPTRSVVTFPAEDKEAMVMYQTYDGEESKAMAFELVRNY